MDNDQKLEPLLRAAMDADSAERAQSANLSAGILENADLWEVIVLYAGSAEALNAAFSDYEITFLLNNYAIFRLPEYAIPTLAASPLVIYVEKPKRLFFSLLGAKRTSCISAVQNARPGVSGVPSLTGRDTLVAVIDSGIDYTHPDFRAPDGSSRIRFLWDQTIAPDSAKGYASPPGYSLGSVFSGEELDRALNAATIAERERICPSRDTSGHGTHVAGIAAGNGRASDGVYRGVAYEAELLVVKLGSPARNGFPSTTELMQAVDFCARYAIAQNRPLAINLSFGNTYGSHSGTSLLETYLNSVARLGILSIVVGSGNEGNAAGHTGGRLRGGETRRVEFSVGEYESSLSIQLWKNYWDELRFSIIAPSGSAVVVPDTPGSWRFRMDGTALFVYYGEPSPYSIYQEIYVEFFGENNYIAPGNWSLVLSAQRVSNGIYDLWMPAFAIRGNATQFLTPTPEITLTIPSTASSVISVGAYDGFFDTPASFSGRGYTWNTNQVKPDLTAPGVDIVSCAPGGGYEARSGTSMATSFVTGSAALLMQWGVLYGNDPFLYGEKLKACLIRGARRLPFTSDYPNPEAGWGALCLKDSFPD